ncbi:LysR family transcriptional regulator [Microbulbifer sp. MKSA007]|uniref:LysR family transcriptional regulator n=1 Tax=Microbulbifer sp. VAAF005 TaxID=3034230 RepID=UPI0024AE100F|nr:LysR family transcriptional regulator [Microbulbifer sp. VAAF005]WHI47723.1 LysR family transcriptional regulator [Microbulbifer sp. VAAF005]WNZ58050.1 LysR family transcriptional regulator [Microbulbifer sp. MKSA007]
MIVRDLETIDFRTLSIFVTTCRLLSLTQCAEELGLPKSTVSKAISKLEEQLQAKLLERSTRKIEITDAGRVTLRRASLLVEEFKSLREDVREIEQQVQGLLRVSAPRPWGATWPSIFSLHFSSSGRKPKSRWSYPTLLMTCLFRV